MCWRDESREGSGGGAQTFQMLLVRLAKNVDSTLVLWHCRRFASDLDTWCMSMGRGLLKRFPALRPLLQSRSSVSDIVKRLRGYYTSSHIANFTFWVTHSNRAHSKSKRNIPRMWDAYARWPPGYTSMSGGVRACVRAFVRENNGVLSVSVNV